jgi:hypothetical protein
VICLILSPLCVLHVQVVQCLTELGLSVKHARISSDGGWFVDGKHHPAWASTPILHNCVNGMRDFNPELAQPLGYWMPATGLQVHCMQHVL